MSRGASASASNASDFQGVGPAPVQYRERDMVPRIVGFLSRGTSSFAGVLLGAGLASAAESVDECISAFESAQVERDQGRLTRARELLLTCSRELCPTVIRQDCREWLFELEPRVPTLVLRARLEDGQDVADVRVFVDGELLAESDLMEWPHSCIAPPHEVGVV